MTDFVYTPDILDENVEFAVDRLQFGDGYSGVTPMGLNNGLRVWSVTFSDRSKAEADVIRDFLVSKKGSLNFSWRPIGFDADVYVVCTKYSRPIQNRFANGTIVYTITAEFRETPS